MSASVIDISKAFQETQALRGVSLGVAEGEVHALLGANGSGKSTLVKCLSGAELPDAGTITVGAATVPGFDSPAAATASGVRVIHQGSPLVASLSIVENFALRRGYRTNGPVGRIRWRQLRAGAQETLDKYELPLDPNALAGALGPADRALASLAVTLDDVEGGIELLILDEVTASIPEREAMAFMVRVRRLPELGIPILMVTHRLKEVFEFADQVSVLSDGEWVHGGPVSAVTQPELVHHMVSTAPGVAAQAPPAPAARQPRGHAAASGKEAGDGEEPADTSLAGLDVAPEASAAGPAGPALEIEQLAGAILRDVSLTVEAGEIVGIVGLPDSGIGELPEILSGGMRRSGGVIRVAGKTVAAQAGPRDAIAAGIGVVPRDRLSDGGVMSLSVADNITLPEVRRFWHRRRAEARTVRQLMDAFDIRPRDPATMFGALSGGNQQKVMLAKWLLTHPTVLVLDDPTVGVDPAARAQIFDLLHQATERGLAIVIFSSEPEELAAHCSRVVVLRNGRVADEISTDRIAAEEAGELILTLSSNP